MAYRASGPLLRPAVLQEISCQQVGGEVANRYPAQSAILGAQAPAPAIQDFFSLNKVTLIHIHFQRAVVLPCTACSSVG